MNNIEKRLKNIETILQTNFNHHGAFIIIIENNKYKILNKEVKKNIFNSKKELENYIYEKYDCKKYVFITFDTSKI